MSRENAVAFWALQARPQSRGRLKELLDIQRQVGPVASLFSTTIVHEDGRVDAVLEPLPFDEEPSEDLLNKHLWHLAASLQMVPAHMAESVRHVVSEEHPWQEDMLDWLLTDNPLVPAGHEELYRLGFKAALQGDRVTSVHVLVPQVEHSIREALRQAGAPMLRFSRDGTQSEKLLGELLNQPEANAVFGEDLTFALRGFLVEQEGSNLRKRRARFAFHPSLFGGRERAARAAGGVVADPRALRRRTGRGLLKAQSVTNQGRRRKRQV